MRIVNATALLLLLRCILAISILYANGSRRFQITDKEEEESVSSDDNAYFVVNGTNGGDLTDPSRRIFRGSKTKIKYYPFLASIHVQGQFRCAGSIIKSDLVITACSCVQLLWNNRFYRENPKILSVRVGSTYPQGSGEEVSAQEVYFHPLYNPKTLAHNLVIIRLYRRLHFKKRRVKKINLATRGRNWNAVRRVTMLGWGATSRSNVIKSAWKNRLSAADLPVYPLSDCKYIYQRKYVTIRHFCTGFFTSGGGACNGDVGGPGVIGGELVGVVSFGSPVCGAPDSPTVFTKLVYYLDWIQDIMDMEPPRKTRTTESWYDKKWDNHWYFGTTNSNKEENQNEMIATDKNIFIQSTEIKVTPITLYTIRNKTEESKDTTIEEYSTKEEDSTIKENSTINEYSTMEEDSTIEEENNDFGKDEETIEDHLDVKSVEVAREPTHKNRKKANKVTIMIDF